MAGRLAGKRALVTAAGQGIGRATALAFAAEGASVLATDIAEEKLAPLADALIATRQLDVTDDGAIVALADELGPVDVLFNCAGFVHHGTILDVSPVEWDASFVLNVRSMYMMIRVLLPKMVERNRRLDHQHVVDRLLDQRRSEPLRLCGDQGCGDRTDQIGGGRLHRVGDTLQRDLPGHDRNAVARRADRRARRARNWRQRSRATGVCRATASRSARPAGGGRGTRGLPRIGRVVVHDRCDPCDRRRLHPLTLDRRYPDEATSLRTRGPGKARLARSRRRDPRPLRRRPRYRRGGASASLA